MEMITGVQVLMVIIIRMMMATMVNMAAAMRQMQETMEVQVPMDTGITGMIMKNMIILPTIEITIEDTAITDPTIGIHKIMDAEMKTVSAEEIIMMTVIFFKELVIS
jgi:hypothetical protein